MEAIFNYIQTNPEEFAALVAAFFGLCVVVARITPNKHDDKIVNALIKVVNVFGLNIKGLKDGQSS